MSVLPSSSSCCAQTVVAFVAIIIVLFHQTCSAKHHRFCSPSSCGKIGNIAYPFRLKGDPRGCGLRRYELDCVNNVTLLTLFSGKYYVQDINYNKYQIRLTDAGVVEDSPCSFPRYHLSPRNFPFGDFEEDSIFPDSVSLTMQHYPASLVFLNCSNRVSDDPRYVEMNAGQCDSGGHIYAVLDREDNYEYTSEFTLMDIKVGCRLKVATFFANLMQSRNASYTNFTYDRNVSYSYIRKLLVDGFWLSWLTFICRDQCGDRLGTYCSVNQTTRQIECLRLVYCRLLVYDSSYCGTPARILGDTLQYIEVVIKGFVNRIKHIKQSLSYSSDYKEYLIGQDVLPIFMVARYLFGVALLLGLFIYIWRRRHFSMYDNIENFLLENNLNPIRYEYREIKKMTRGFKEKLGQGGFGHVYKGKLRSRSDVAIKMLSKAKGNGQDFVNEVATIGRIHHVNVVRLIGYCVEGEKRALIYEYMPNGSLDKYIFSKEGSVPLSYEKTYEISLGIARGISYLHRGCDVQILHFDIKPHNILLDDNLIPKVSDFGLAKLYPVKDGSLVLTAARGTLGYMAPELFYKNIGGVSHKADVYSFGMLLMEMGSRRRNSNSQVEHSSQHYFPFWIYDQFKEEKDFDMEDASEEDKILVKKMFIVALWCIQLKPNDRPSMKNVVEMLEGKVESLEMPPRPSYYPHETNGHDDEINFDQTSWSASTSSNKNLGKTKSNYSMENNA